MLLVTPGIHPERGIAKAGRGPRPLHVMLHVHVVTCCTCCMFSKKSLENKGTELKG